jgi:predicted MPP superfamily phosphohydrolase
MAYGYFIEPYWLDVHHVSIESSKLTVGATLRIAHISDIHSDNRPRLEERLPVAIAAERPDMIVFTGDSLNSGAGLPVFRKLMASLPGIAPTFGVKGNWDVGSPFELFEDTGVHELVGVSTSVDIRGTTVWVAGFAPDDPREVREVVSTVPREAFTIFLAHYPDLIPEVAQEGIDLYCAGHTHGGQVALPLFGALVTFSKFGKRYEAGLHREGNTFLYVNRGIGMEGGHAPRVRFWARPELTIIDVTGKRK